MTDAAQIRRCSGALRANHLLLQAPHPKISNREPIRLEMHVTHTKQRTARHSNREHNASFSDLNQLTRRRDPRISNREAPRLEMHVTHTKQRAAYRSNREKQTVFKSTSRGGPFAPFADAPPGFRPPFLPPQPTRTPQHIPPTPNLLPQNPILQSPQKPKNTKIPPQSLFRLERTPTPYF